MKPGLLISLWILVLAMVVIVVREYAAGWYVKAKRMLEEMDRREAEEEAEDGGKNP